MFKLFILFVRLYSLENLQPKAATNADSTDTKKEEKTEEQQQSISGSTSSPTEAATSKPCLTGNLIIYTNMNVTFL